MATYWTADSSIGSRTWEYALLQVTLDGTPKHHDRYRALPDGTGTFDTIRRNIENLCRLTQDDFELIIRINCSESDSRTCRIS